jgi:hypothetical protein
MTAALALKLRVMQAQVSRRIQSLYNGVVEIHAVNDYNRLQIM